MVSVRSCRIQPPKGLGYLLSADSEVELAPLSQICLAFKIMFHKRSVRVR